MGKNPPSNAGLIPGRGTKIPHAMGQLSPCTATTEPVPYTARVPQLESPHAATTEPACSGACVPQLESPHATMKDPVCRDGDPARCN